jgi:cephalosporin hydroxylase
MQLMREVARSYLSLDQRRRLLWALNRARYYHPMQVLRRFQVRKYPALPDGRGWRTAISPLLHRTFQEGTIDYSYRGIQMAKYPFEIALYMRLIWEMRPGTIIEIGTNRGGAAIWMADMLNLFGISGRVVAVDLNVPQPSYVPTNVEFLQGDAYDIGKALTPDILASLPRPWIVIEDSEHTYGATKGILNFFDPHMHSGEYIIVEDTCVGEMGAKDWDEQPGKAIDEFLRERPNAYEIDARYCDQYGRNVTSNPNGYLRKK